MWTLMWKTAYVGTACTIVYFTGKAVLRPHFPSHKQDVSQKRRLAVRTLRCRLASSGKISPYATQVQVFYPIDTNQAAVSTTTSTSSYFYFRDEAVDGLSNWLRLPPALLGFVLKKQPHPHPPITVTSSSTSSSPKYPVLLFSHGLGGTYEMYTKTCADLAAKGMIVIAMEHQDRSGSYAEKCVMDSNAKVAKQILYFKRPPAGMPYERTYVSEFRRPFLETRAKEIEYALEYLHDVKSRCLHENDEGGEKENNDDSATLGLDRLLTTRADLENICLAGHSFGGASTAFVSRRVDAPSIRCCLLLDPWLFALDKDHECFQKGMAKPTMSVVCDRFFESPEFRINSELNDATTYRGKQEYRSFLAKGTVHSSFADTPYWLPLWLARLLRSKELVGDANPHVAQREIIDAAWDFVREHCGACPAGDALPPTENSVLFGLPLRRKPGGGDEG